MGLATTSVNAVLLAAVLTSALTTTDSRWSKELTKPETSSSSDWVPMPVPCTTCQPNDRISTAADQADVASLLTPPLPDYQQQFHEQRPVAPPQQNAHQQFVQQAQEEALQKFQRTPEQQRVNVQKPDVLKQFASPTTPQFLPGGQNGGIQLIPQNSHTTGPGGPNQVIQQTLPHDFPLPQAGFPLLFPQETPNGQAQFNADPNRGRNNQFQQFFQQQPPPTNFDQQFGNDSDSSSEEKPDVQLVYVPVEALQQRGRFHIPRKPVPQNIPELKTDSQLQVEPSALAAEETRQQRQSFQQFVEQPPTRQSPPEQAPGKARQEAQRAGLQQQGPQDQQSIRQQLLQALRALPTDVPQEHVPVTEHFFSDPSHGVLSTRIPQLAQQQSQQHPFLTNEGHFLQTLRPLPTNIPNFQQHPHQRPDQQLLSHPTQISQFQFQQAQQPQTNEDHFLQFLRPITTNLPQVHTQVPDEPRPTSHEISQTQRPVPSRAPQSHRLGGTQSSTQPPVPHTQRPLQATRTPQAQPAEADDNSQYQEQRFTSTTTTKPTKPVPHQPPLSVYMGKEGHEIKVTDVIKVLKNAKTIAVLDSVGPESPQVFVGPSNLKPPLTYAKFELPYLSSIESNRVERKVDEFPFFVAPLNFKPPPGYSKIPFPAPHIGSVVVSNSPPQREEVESPTTVKPSRGRFASQYNLPAELPAINPQLPTLVNSLQDSRQNQGNVFPTPNRHITNVQQPQLRRPHQRVPPQQPQEPQFQQVQQSQREQQEEIQPFREPELAPEVPPTAQFSPTQQVPHSNRFSQPELAPQVPPTAQFSPTQQVPHSNRFSQPELAPQVPPTAQFSPTQQVPHSNRFSQPELAPQVPPTAQFSPKQQVPHSNRFSQFQHVSTTPQPQLPSTRQPPQFHQPPQFQEQPFFQQQPPFQAPSRIPPTPQFPQTQTEIDVQDTPQFTQFVPSHFPSHPRRPEQPQHVTQIPEVTTFPQYTENNQLSNVQQSSQFLQETSPVSQSPEIQQYIQHQEALQTQTPAPAPQEETVVQETEPSTTPTPRIPKRRPSYRARQRTTETPSTDDVTTTTRRPYTRGRRPTFTRQRVQAEATTAQYQAAVEQEPSSTTEYATGLKYSTRIPVRAQDDTGRFHSSRVTAQEETTRRNLPRSRGRTRERNSHRVTGQNIPNYPRQSVETEQVTPQPEQEYVVPAHESKRQQQVFNHNYNTERSGFEEPTTEQNRVEQPDSRFEENQSNLQQRINPIVENVQQPQRALHFQNVQIVSSTGQPLVDYQTSENYFHVPTASPQDSVPFRELDVAVTTPPQDLRSQGQSGIPHFTLPVQVAVPGRTERPEAEDTPRPVYVRIRGQTRGRRPHAQADGAQRVQQVESGGRLQKPVQQFVQQQVTDQEPFHQNQQRRPAGGAVHNYQQPLNRPRPVQLPVAIPQQQVKVAQPEEESEEEYGFIRPVNFPPQVATTEATSIRSQEPSLYEENQSQESLDVLDGTDETTPLNKVRQNFLVRTPNRRPVKLAQEGTTTPATIYTVRPNRRPQPVKQQVRITSVRGRMRRPTTSTTEQPQDFHPQSQSPPPSEVQFVKRRPANRYNPSEASNEVAGEPQDGVNTPRSSLQRYEAQTRGTVSFRRPGGQQEDHTPSQGSSTPSTFQITLLDEPPNYPAHFTAKLQAQNQLNYQQRPEDLTSLNSDHLPHYLEDDPEGGAESQWTSKRLSYTHTGKEGTTPLITFTTEYPKVEQTATETPVQVSTENFVAETESVGVEYPREKLLSSSVDTEQATTGYPSDESSNTSDDGKTAHREEKETESTQKKAGDPDANKKPGSRRRGSWVRRRKVPRPQDVFETAESIHIGAVSKNQIQHMASKGIHINRWPLPSPALVTDQTVFDVPKISPEDPYVTIDENAGPVEVLSSVEDGSSSVKESGGKKEEVEIVSTTPEPNIVTEQNKDEEVTSLYVTPNPEEVSVNIKKENQEDVISITTESPVIETTTQQNFEEIQKVDDKPLSVNQSNGSAVDLKDEGEANKEIEAKPEPTPGDVKIRDIPDKTPVEDKVQFKEVKPEISAETNVQVGEEIKEEVKEKVNEEITTETPVEKAKDEGVAQEEVTEEPEKTVKEEEIKDQTAEESVSHGSVHETLASTSAVDKTDKSKRTKTNEEHLSIQSSVQDAIQQNTPTEGTTYRPDREIEDLFNPPTTTEVAPEELESPDEIIRTSMRTEISHETEICYRGRCVKTKTADNDHLVE